LEIPENIVDLITISEVKTLWFFVLNAGKRIPMVLLLARNVVHDYLHPLAPEAPDAALMFAGRRNRRGPAAEVLSY